MLVSEDRWWPTDLLGYRAIQNDQFYRWREYVAWVTLEARAAQWTWYKSVARLFSQLLCCFRYASFHGCVLPDLVQIRRNVIRRILIKERSWRQMRWNSLFMESLSEFSAERFIILESSLNIGRIGFSNLKPWKRRFVFFRITYPVRFLIQITQALALELKPALILLVVNRFNGHGRSAHLSNVHQITSKEHFKAAQWGSVIKLSLHQKRAQHLYLWIQWLGIVGALMPNKKMRWDQLHLDKLAM